MGNIVQLVEQRTENPCVTGSSPVVATTLAWQNDYATDCKSVYPGLIPGVNSNVGEVLRKHDGLQNHKPGFDSLHRCHLTFGLQCVIMKE